MNRLVRASASLPALTLFLPGLGEPPVDRPASAFLGDLSIPALIRVMSRGDPVDGPSGEVERALFSLFGIDPGDGLPAAAVTRQVEDRLPEPGPEPKSPKGRPTVVTPDPEDRGAAARRGWWLRADPVHLRPDLSKLLLFDAGSFALAAGEAAALADEVAPLFAEAGAVLEVGAPSRWYLRLDAPLDLQTSSLSAVLGQDLRGHRPAGADARRWQALLTEVQMTLFASPVNQAREARGELPVNSLWLWGGGRLTEPSTPRWSHVWAEDALAAGLARFSGVPRSLPPPSAHDWLAAAQAGPAGGGGHLLVDAGLWRAARYGDVEGWRVALLTLESGWLAPLVEALSAGRLAALTVLSGAGRGYRLDRGGLWRWWRRARPAAAPWGDR